MVTNLSTGMKSVNLGTDKTVCTVFNVREREKKRERERERTSHLEHGKTRKAALLISEAVFQSFILIEKEYLI